MHTIHLLRLNNMPIFRQLQLEEALLRTDERNWFLINQGSPPAIVMGISGQPTQLLEAAEVFKQEIPVIKRFSGGGTVVIDPHTLFTTWIGNRELLDIPCFPEPLMRWSGEFYAQALQHPAFSLRENDYLLHERKCGGNAQYIRKARWLHHTSFLWDYDPSKMRCLKMPSRTPNYRAGRSHEEFICRLKDHFSSSEHIVDGLMRELSRRYNVIEMPTEAIDTLLTRPFRQTTHLIL
jgi:lipoate-protein ligase A